VHGLIDASLFLMKSKWRQMVDEDFCVFVQLRENDPVENIRQSLWRDCDSSQTHRAGKPRQSPNRFGVQESLSRPRRNAVNGGAAPQRTANG
jgi:hypothetical protein